jgi:tRNA-dependent cyclodipeptide synthase
MILPDRYFVPVCLYPHTKYRTAEGVAALFEKYLLSSREYLVIVADRLLVLDRLVTGRYFTVNSAISKARSEAKQVVSLIRRIAQKTGADTIGRIVYWDDVAETAEFFEFASRLRQAVLADDFLAQAIEDFIDRRVKRFGAGSDPDREREYERDYLLSEVCMSVYCTEVLGFCNEVWERPPPPDIPDPLRLLYQHRPELVTRITTRPAVRTLHFLYKEGNRSADHAPKENVTQG